MQCSLLCCSVFAPLGYSISQIYAIYIVRQHCSIQFRNSVKSLPQLLMISCCIYSEHSCVVEMATRFIRIFCRPHDLSDIHLETLETRHFVSVTIIISDSLLNWTQLTYYACLHMFYALTGAMCTVMLSMLRHLPYYPHPGLGTLCTRALREEVVKVNEAEYLYTLARTL